MFLSILELFSIKHEKAKVFWVPLAERSIWLELDSPMVTQMMNPATSSIFPWNTIFYVKEKLR